MIAACLMKRSASRPRSRIIRAPCPFYNPFRNNFFTCSRQGCALLTKTHPIRKAFLQKKPVLPGLSAPSWPSAIGNPAQSKFRVATDTLNKVRFEHIRGLLTMDLPTKPLNPSEDSEIHWACNNQPQGLWAFGTIVRRLLAGTTPKPLQKQQRKPAQEKHKLKVVCPNLP